MSLKSQDNYIKKNVDYINSRIIEISNEEDFISKKVTTSNIISSLIDDEYKTKNTNIQKNIFNLKKIISSWFIEKDGDILGYIYQCLESFNSKKSKGQYFTPDIIVDYIVEKTIPENIDPFKIKILDPACGSGQFLISAFKRLVKIYSSHGYNLSEIYPHIIQNNLYGYDIDEIAIKIINFNLRKLCENYKIKTNVLKNNFLLKDDLELSSNKTNNNKFDFIIGNPPWGSKISKEEKIYYKNNYDSAKSGINSFSLFLDRSIDLLKEKAKLGFLIPEAFLNIKAHRSVRLKTLDESSISEIVIWGDQFKNVYAPCISIILKKAYSFDKPEKNNIKIYKSSDFSKNEVSIIPQNYYYKTFENIFNINFSSKSVDIINQISNQESTFLKDNAKFFLGIVTGGNNEHIKNNYTEEYPDKILMGNDVTPYKINFSNKHFKYCTKTLQQAAPQELYKTKNKILYKFIGKNLTFAHDKNGFYTVNNINGFIPNNEVFNIDILVAILNSKLMQYYYQNNFFTLKVLKGNLEKLPIKNINKTNLSYLNSLSKLASNSISNRELKLYTEKIDDIVFHEYGFKDKDAYKIYDKVITSNNLQQTILPGFTN